MAAISSDALVSSIQSEIQRVTNDLKGVDENLKRLTGRDFNEPRGERRIRLSSIGGREDEPPPKRRPPGGVFARLGEPVSDSHRGRRVHEVSEEEGEIPRHKPSVASSVARPIIDGKSRTEAAAELSKDKASRDRNRRMFGALLGTLQRFRTEEAKQKGKDEQRAKIEKKLEEKGRAEKEELQREKMDLISQRKERQARIRRLNIKIERVKEHEAWEEYQRRLGNFIRSQTKPRIFWIPKIIHPRTSQLLSDTKEVIERELEEERHRLKEELDEVLGGKLDVPMREEEGDEEEEEEEERGREGEGNRMDFNNGSDLLDYDAEEGELVYEDDLLLPGKKQRERKRGERVVVQVESSVNKAPQRRVELVTVVADRSKRGREAEGNESEKENVLRSKISVESRSGKESGGEKGKGRVREKKNREKEDKKEKERNKGKEKKSHSEKETNTKSVPLKDSLAKRESKTSKKTRPRNDNESQKEKEEQSSVQASVTTEANEPEEEIWSEDLSHISLPLEPEPAVTEVVVQHVPMEGLTDDTTDTNGDVGEMQVETVLIDTSNIKKDKTVWEEALVHRPLVIKQEKDASPQQKEKEDAKAIEKPEKAQSEESESSSESSSDTEESSSEEEGTSFSNSSDDSSGSSSSSESEEEKEGKKKKGEKGKAVNKKEKSSSSESESSSDDDEDDDDDAKRTPSKKKPSGEKTSPKNSRKEEKGGERQGDRKREEKRKGVRSRSRERRSRSRSRERRRRRSRSRERRSRSRERSSKSREKRSRSRERRRDRSRSRERRRDRR